MHITLKLSAFVLAGVMLLPSCSTDNLELPSEELYARAFIKEFGLVKPANSFNIATQSKVKVVTQSPTRVKITANVNGREYLFADYSSVDGSQEISFDLPKGVTDIFIRANGKKIPAKVGGTVNLSSKAGRAETGEKFFCNNKISFIETEPRIFESVDVYDIITVLPEEEPNTQHEGVYSDFYFSAKAGDEMTFYPLFWNTSSCHSLGIYWLNDEGEFHWYDLDSNGRPINTEKTVTDKKEAVMNNYMQDLYRSRSGRLFYSNNYDKTNPDAAEWNLASNATSFCSYPGVTEGKLPDPSESVAFKAIGITLKFYDNVKYGFFLKVKGQQTPLDIDEDGYVGDYSHIFFSQAKRNQYYGRVFKKDNKYFVKDDITETSNGNIPQYYTPDGSELYTWQSGDDGFNTTAWRVEWWGSDAQTNFKKGITNYSRAAYTTVPQKDKEGNIIRNRSYFAFEDWSNGPIDLNDLIFIMDDSTVGTYDGNDNPIDPEEPVDPEIPAYEWIIAAEDLGNTYDWDFNDMVVAISYVTTDDPAKKEIKVRPLAAGGTMRLYLMFDNPATSKTEMVGKEIHNWLGGASNTPINVSANGEENAGEEVSIEWTSAEAFSLASHLDKTGLNETVTNMGGFWVLVDKEGKYDSSSDFSDVKNDDGSQAVTPNLVKGDSYSPQMICLGGQWCWPQEEQPIHEVYLGFKGWLNEPETVGAKWYGADADFDRTRVVTRASLTKPEEQP